MYIYNQLFPTSINRTAVIMNEPRLQFLVFISTKDQLGPTYINFYRTIYVI